MKEKDDDDTSAGGGQAASLLRSPEMLSALQALEALDPHGAAMFRKALRQLQLFVRENVMLLDPTAAMLN